jgi:hypothetical protein
MRPVAVVSLTRKASLTTFADLARNGNPRLPSALRAVTTVEAFVLAVAGVLPFFFPDTALRKWPWESAPFNIRFIGAVYLTSLAAVVVWLAFFRWAPGRVALPMLVVFTNLILVLSLVYVDRFDFGEFSTWAWFVLYVVIPVSATYHYWRYRRLPPADSTPVPSGWRSFFRAEAAVAGLYGLGLLVAPGTFSDFWPWEIDAFHGRLYSAIFLTLAVAAFTVSRVAAPAELLLVGMTQLTLGLFSILGLVIVDASKDTVDWSSPGTWLWNGAFAALLISGMALVLRSLSAPGRVRPAL